jgi:hypothetical protein
LAITRAKTSSVAQGPSTKRTLLADNPAILSGSYESIATATPAGSSTFTFSSIPSTYQHLQIRYTARDARAIGINSFNMQFNGDTGSNYMRGHILYGDGATAAASVLTTSFTSILVGYEAAASAATNTFGVGVIDILDYANTNKNKTTRTLCGTDLNGSGEVDFMSGLWMSTAAISSITLIVGTSANWSTGTSFALYGIK